MAYQKLTPIIATGASAPRYLGDRFADFVNVKDFGATGDGTTDDTAAFTAAETAAAGKVVFVPQGAYNVDATELSGIYVSDGPVDAVNLRVANLVDFVKSSDAFRKLQGLSFPFRTTRSVGFPNIPQTTYWIQSICYDSKRDVFYVGQDNLSDDSLAGYIHTFTDILDPTTKTDSTAVSAGHFNCMDYDAVNDKVYIAPGSTYANSVLVYNPTTKLLEDPITTSSSCWELAVGNDGYLYVLGQTGIERYLLSTKQKDAKYSIPVSTPLAGQASSVTGQGSFIYSGVFVIMYNTYVDGHINVIYNCYNLATGENYTISHNCDRACEIEDATVKNGVLYAIGSSSLFVTIIEYYLDRLNNESKKFAKVIPQNADLNNYITEGEYVVVSGPYLASCQHGPDNNGKNNTGCGKMVVEYVCSTDQIQQTIYTRGGHSWKRYGSAESAPSISWSSWRPIGELYEQNWNDYTSLNEINRPGVACVGSVPVGEAPAGINGMVLLMDTGNDAYRFKKEIYSRWGTIGTDDHQTYIRSGAGVPGSSSQPFTWGNWVKIITEKDRFNNNLTPEDDNAWVLGNGGRRWKVVYSATGSINTSDEREKDNIEEVPAALLQAWASVKFDVFQFKEAIEKKGSGARIHVGFVAQQVMSAFKDSNVDPERYGLFCYDEWDDEFEEDTVIDEPAVYDENNDIVVPAKTHVEKRQTKKAGSRYGIRYEEALALECAYLRSRIGKMQEQINSLAATVERLTSQQNN